MRRYLQRFRLDKVDKVVELVDVLADAIAYADHVDVGVGAR